MKLIFLPDLTIICDYFMLKNQLWDSTETPFFLEKNQKNLVVIVLRSPKNAQFLTSVLTRCIGGCGGYPLSSISILNVKKQIPLPEEHVHVPCLSQTTVLVGNI